MKTDNRLSLVLHALLHMAEQDTPMTSDALGVCLDANPVVVRRTMGLLREAGFVRAGRGHAGGWSLAVDLASLNLRKLYEALGAPGVFAIGNRSDAPECLVEQAVNAVMGDAFAEAEALLLRRFGEVSLADLQQDFTRRHAARLSEQET